MIATVNAIVENEPLSTRIRSPVEDYFSTQRSRAPKPRLAPCGAKRYLDNDVFFMAMVEAPMVTLTLQHAIRALVRLATLPEGEAVLSRDIAHATGVPPSYLSKVLGQLTRAGITCATRGKNGGYRLARSAASIRLAEVAAAVGAIDTSRCLLGPGKCAERGECGAHERWSTVVEATTRFLATTTLADLALPREDGTRATILGSSRPVKRATGQRSVGRRGRT